MYVRKKLAISAAAACVGALAAGAGFAPAAAAATPPALGGPVVGTSGEVLEAGGGFPGSATVSFACSTTGNSTITFHVASGEALGPYPGTFTADGTVTLGPRPGPLSSPPPVGLTETFHITSINGDVTGTKTLELPPAEYNATCGDGGYAQLVAANYQAEIVTTTGQRYRDSGTSHVTVVGFNNYPASSYFYETFESSNGVASETPTPTSKDQCKNGGYQNYVDDQGQPFKNEGDCVSFVAAHTENHPD